MSSCHGHHVIVSGLCHPGLRLAPAAAGLKLSTLACGEHLNHKAKWISPCSVMTPKMNHADTKSSVALFCKALSQSVYSVLV